MKLFTGVHRNSWGLRFRRFHHSPKAVGSRPTNWYFLFKNVRTLMNFQQIYYQDHLPIDAKAVFQVEFVWIFVYLFWASKTVLYNIQVCNVIFSTLSFQFVNSYYNSFSNVFNIVFQWPQQLNLSKYFVQMEKTRLQTWVLWCRKQLLLKLNHHHWSRN